MRDKIEVLGISLDYLNVEQEMERLAEFMENDRLDSIGMITMNTLLLAEKEPAWKKYLENLDLSVIGEREILEVVGITSGQVYDEVSENEFPARMFWYIINRELRVFLLGESKEEVEALEKYLLDTYPGIQIVGSAADVAGEGASADSMINELNSFSPDVIISGLQGIRQDQFLMENRQKINGKIWLGLGEHPEIQNEAGLKVGWWSTLLKKTTFRRMVSKFKEDQGE